jgi:hypothetical protein
MFSEDYDEDDFDDDDLNDVIQRNVLHKPRSEEESKVQGKILSKPTPSQKDSNKRIAAIDHAEGDAFL